MSCQPHENPKQLKLLPKLLAALYKLVVKTGPLKITVTYLTEHREFEQVPNYSFAPTTTVHSATGYSTRYIFSSICFSSLESIC